MSRCENAPAHFFLEKNCSQGTVVRLCEPAGSGFVDGP
jgi:hypothetical protein